MRGGGGRAHLGAIFLDETPFWDMGRGTLHAVPGLVIRDLLICLSISASLRKILVLYSQIWSNLVTLINSWPVLEIMSTKNKTSVIPKEKIDM